MVNSKQINQIIITLGFDYQTITLSKEMFNISPAGNDSLEEDYINFLIEVVKNKCCEDLSHHTYDKKEAFALFINNITTNN